MGPAETTMTWLAAEVVRLRTENAELRQRLAESEAKRKAEEETRYQYGFQVALSQTGGRR